MVRHGDHAVKRGLLVSGTLGVSSVSVTGLLTAATTEVCWEGLNKYQPRSLQEAVVPLVRFRRQLRRSVGLDTPNLI
jgi:hypothetical protein